MPPSGVDYASEFLNGYAPEYVHYPLSYSVVLLQMMSLIIQQLA